MIEYKSCFAKSMQDMVDYRVSLGYIAASYENRLKRLDTFIAENYPSEATLTKQMVLHYVSQQDSDKASVRQNKALIIRLFAEYLISTGKDAYVLPRNYISNSKSSFSPHIFTDRELTDLFHMVDHLPETEDILRRCTAAVLLRLIYTCGLRPGEGLRLKRKNVNLDTGEILITETKLKKERVVVMHDDMNRLMRKYAMQVALAGREQSSYFFPDSELEAYTTAWLENILKTCYKNTVRRFLQSICHGFVYMILDIVLLLQRCADGLMKGKIYTICFRICVPIWVTAVYRRRHTTFIFFPKIF